jgi:hypothetical protein
MISLIKALVIALGQWIALLAFALLCSAIFIAVGGCLGAGLCWLASLFSSAEASTVRWEAFTSGAALAALPCVVGTGCILIISFPALVAGAWRKVNGITEESAAERWVGTYLRVRERVFES